MKQLQLTNGMFASVDDEDLQRCNLFTWGFQKSRGYVQGRAWGKNTLLHIFILDYPPYQIDHKDRNKLNCQKENLRPCVQNQNLANSVKKKNGTQSKYKGVTYHDNKYRATIGHNRKQIFLGYFEIEIEAARAHDKALVEFFGEFARTNL